MINFNILYEDDENDVDIICVPEVISSQMENIAQEFLDWLPNADAENNLYWKEINGDKCNICETDGFIEWLNNNYCSASQKAYIVAQHVCLHDEYDNVVF